MGNDSLLVGLKRVLSRPTSRESFSFSHSDPHSILCLLNDTLFVCLFVCVCANEQRKKENDSLLVGLERTLFSSRTTKKRSVAYTSPSSPSSSPSSPSSSSSF